MSLEFLEGVLSRPLKECWHVVLGDTTFLISIPIPIIFVLVLTDTDVNIPQLPFEILQWTTLAGLAKLENIHSSLCAATHWMIMGSFWQCKLPMNILICSTTVGALIMRRSKNNYFSLVTQN